VPDFSFEGSHAAMTSIDERLGQVLPRAAAGIAEAAEIAAAGAARGGISATIPPR
jgi:hypothetical protein